MTEEKNLQNPQNPAEERDAAVSARLFTEAELMERLRTARAGWEAEGTQAAEAMRAEAFGEGKRAAEEEAGAVIAELRAELDAARAASVRRETEIRCGRLLRERGLSEALASVMLAPGETAASDEVLLTRAEALAGAVEAAAAEALRRRTAGMLPGIGEAAPLSAQFIRDTPVAKLSQMMR